MPKATAPTDKHKALAYKQQGNHAFATKDWATAVGHYTAAHFADPNEPTYPLNRAMAYIKLGKFVDAERDCTTALKLSPNNVKALYRRATSQVGEEKFDLAVRDYQAVLRLDPNNAEAKTGLSKARHNLERTSAPKREPIDLRSAVGPLGMSDPSSSDVESTSQKSSTKDSSSSVEAARKFLQQVGLSDDSQEKASPTSKASTSALPPPKYPGETGGFLREVTTRKTNPKPSTQKAPNDLILNAHASSLTSALPSSTAKQASTRDSSTSSTAKKTASALNFGASSSQPQATPTPRQLRIAPQATSGKMSAIEFHRKWKDKSDRLNLLSSLDPDSIPAMIDAMLEPELVGEILQTLAEGHSSSPDQEALNRLTSALLQALPRCKRFGMTVCMLDSSEKGYAASLIETAGKPDLKAVWEV